MKKNIKICTEWHSNKTINPFTKRTITKKGAVYKSFEKVCSSILINKIVQIPTTDIYLTRGSAIGDGSCLFHTLVQLLFNQKGGGIELRKTISETINPDLILNNFFVGEIEPNCECNEDGTMCVDCIIEKLIEDFGDKSTYANEEMLKITALFVKDLYNLNMCLYNSESTRFEYVIDIDHSLDSIFLYNSHSIHYEPLFGTDKTRIFLASDLQFFYITPNTPKCPEGKDFNIKSSRCIKRCKPTHIRNSRSKCVVKCKHGFSRIHDTGRCVSNKSSRNRSSKSSSKSR